MALRYDTCLDKTPQGWYLCGDITKTQINNHRVPITDEIAVVVKSAVEETKRLSTEFNNPHKLLFPIYRGTRRGLCVTDNQISRALNRLAKQYSITDDAGNLFRFGNHAFRHTKAVELINNGMSLTHVQRYAAEKSKRSLEKVDAAIQLLILAKKDINFNTVSIEAGVSKAYLYNTTAIRKRIETLRDQQKQVPPKQKKHNMTESSKDVLISAKNKRIQQLTFENKRLKQEIAKLLGRKYEEL